MMGEADYNKNKSYCREKLGNLSLVAMQDGILYGPGKDYEYKLDNHRKCMDGWKFLMRDDGRPEKDRYAVCDT